MLVVRDEKLKAVMLLPNKAGALGAE